MRLRDYLLAGGLSLMAGPSLAAVAETDDFVDNINKGSDGPTLEKGNLVVVPIPLSDPTLGTGLQVAALYLHPERSEGGANPTTGVGGMYTDTDSWVAGIFHQDFLLEDRLRVMAAAGTGSFKLEYYGFGGEGFFADNPLDYTIDMAMGFARAQYRLPGTEHWFAGPALLFSEGDVEMDFSELLPVLPAVGKDIALGGAGLVLSYDSRDNNYYPRRGVNFSASWYDFGDHFGSDFDYGKTRLSFSHYASVLPRVVLATNAEYENTAGEAPFFVQSSMAVRGYNRGRYMDDTALTAHLEGRYKFRPRWAVLAFFDYGWIDDNSSQVFDGEIAHSIGTGLHWQTTPDKPLHIGLDVAFTEDDDTVFFIQLGERF